MLRITVTKKPGEGRTDCCLTIEGRLEGPWVNELSNVWYSVSAEACVPVEVELNGVTYASETGAELLRAMQRAGAAFTTRSPLADSWIQDQIADVTRRIAR